jgi:hypothetical protein
MLTTDNRMLLALTLAAVVITASVATLVSLVQ